jgi:hypothetical protein
MRPQGDRYIPLDEWLARPWVRILRQLRWMDWATTEALYLALELPDFDRSWGQERDRFSAALCSLARAGEVQRRRVSSRRWNRVTHANEYRITERGRAALEKLNRDYLSGLESAA